MDAFDNLDEKMIKMITKRRCNDYSIPDVIKVTNTEICTKTEIAKKILSPGYDLVSKNLL